MRIMDMTEAVAPGCKVEYTGIRPGEKIHECLLTEDESRHASEFDDLFIIKPEYHSWTKEKRKGGKPLTSEFRYTSDKNSQWLRVEELQNMIKEV